MFWLELSCCFLKAESSLGLEEVFPVFYDAECITKDIENLACDLILDWGS